MGPSRKTPFPENGVGSIPSPLAPCLAHSKPTSARTTSWSLLAQPPASCSCKSLHLLAQVFDAVRKFNATVFVSFATAVPSIRAFARACGAEGRQTSPGRVKVPLRYLRAVCLAMRVCAEAVGASASLLRALPRQCACMQTVLGRPMQANNK